MVDACSKDSEGSRAIVKTGGCLRASFGDTFVSKRKAAQGNQEGFILISVLGFMVLMAVIAVSVNRKTGLQTRMVADRVQAVQIKQGAKALIEYTKWKLVNNPEWRTAISGEHFDFAGVQYLLTVVETVKPVYGNVIEMTCIAPGAVKAYKAYLTKPAKTKYIYMADSTNDCIRRVNLGTGIITTFAGIGNSSGFYGDDGPAISAWLKEPRGVSVSANGKVYIADTENNRIRVVDIQTGIITTVAGFGFYWFSGDGGPAVYACLRNPEAVSVAPSENIYIADTKNSRVRKVDAATGIITTAAGTFPSGYSGDGGPATNARLDTPSGVFVDENENIYIADTRNNRIRKVDAATGIITTVAGTGAGSYSGDGGPAVSAALKGPMNVARSPSGDLYIADTGNHCVRKVDGITGIISTYAGVPGTSGYSGDGIPATAALLKGVSGVALGQDGIVYINEETNNRIRAVVPGTGLISTLAGTGVAGFSGDNGPAINAKISGPSIVSLPRSEATVYTLSRLKDLY